MALPMRLAAIAPRRRGPRAGEGWWALLFLAPTLIGLAFLSAGPILASFGISLTDWDLLTPPQFVGLDNFSSLLGDDRFLVALRNTAFYTLLSVPIGMVLARPSHPRFSPLLSVPIGMVPPLGLALALTQPLRGIALIRTAYFLPVVTSATAVGLVWAWIYSPANGLLHQVIEAVGLPGQRWISDPFWAMPSIIAMSIWQGLGINVIVF